MKIASAWSIDPNAEVAATKAYEMLSEKLEGVPQLMLVHSSCAYDNETVVRRLRSLAPGVPLQGGTSCLGVMTEDGFHTKEGKGLGILGVHDPDGSYGVGIADSRNDPKAAAQSALNQALAQAARPGEVPSAVLITNHPGHEDLVIRAIEEHIGANVPIIGGTSADNDMSGQWQQFANDTVSRQAVSVATLFPSGDIGYAFHSGYEPTSYRGKVTRAEDRILHEIDSRPAAQVYNEWTGGLISDVLPEGGSLVPRATFSPLGNRVGQVGGIPYYRLSYPVAVVQNKALLLFTEVVPEGNEIVLMTGTHDSLATRAGRVASAAIDAAPFGTDETQGALVLFCTGCMLAIQDRMHESVASIRSALEGAPFLCAFTLGEQGCFIGGENRHGNLMVAVVVFGPMKVG
ncbi:MAG: FIST C-terminal domain-containing protein [candidate division KSB1 bacterium]|nr:FIST C-terminal domain-containing protein [candidate division KSB1 bacterium]